MHRRTTKYKVQRKIRLIKNIILHKIYTRTLSDFKVYFNFSNVKKCSKMLEGAPEGVRDQKDSFSQTCPFAFLFREVFVICRVTTKC